MLKYIFWLLFLAIAHLMVIPKDLTTRLKKVALNWSIILLSGTIALLGSLDKSGQFQTNIKVNWPGTDPVFGSINFAVDGISIFFVILTAFLITICVLVSWDSIKYLIKEFLICLFCIELLLVGVFTILDLIGFYLFFEGVLIPMFIIIGIWGAREEKVMASYYFFFYTFFGSVFMLLGIFMLYAWTGTTDYQVLCSLKIDKKIQYILFLSFFLSLAIKIPKVPFHIWLPQAHVEAPVAGSVILAGILLKLGGYGFIRFSWSLFPIAAEYFSPFLLTLGVLAIIYGGLSTCRQVDLKRIIAYSSITHMGLVIIGIFSKNVMGLLGAIYLMLAHGVVSSSLFIIVTFLYERHHTRLIRYYRGMVITMPLFSGALFLLIIANIAIPLSCNFIGEFICLFAAFDCSPIIGLCASMGIIISVGYSIYLYNRISFGGPSQYLLYSRDLNRREAYILLLLISVIYLMGVFPFYLLSEIGPSVYLG